MQPSHSFSTKAASVLLMAGYAAAEPWGWGSPTTTSTSTTTSSWALATITPCPGAPSNITSLYPITVTKQYQNVSTCVELTASIKGKARTTYSCDDYLFISTVIPCYNGTGPTSTTITATDAIVTVSNWDTTITSYVTPTGHFKHMKPKPTPVYSTIAKEFYVPYYEIGSFALPGFPGSGICGEACAPQPDGSSFQAVNVTECHSGSSGPSCVQYVETWVSSPAPKPTQSATGVCSSHASAPSAGTWTFTFPFTAPAPPAITTGPATWSYDPQAWSWEVTKTCDGPWDWTITETVTTTVTFTVTPSTAPATSTCTVPFPTGPFHGFPGFPPAPSTPTPTAGTSGYIQVFDSGAKYHSSTPSYIGFSNDDGIIVTDQGSAATFTFEDGQLLVGSEAIGVDSAWGYQAFQKYDTDPAVSSGWSTSSSGVAFNFGSGSATFCVASDNSLFIILTSSPAFPCKPVDLSSGGAIPSSASAWAEWTPTTTTSATADPSADWTATDGGIPVVTEWSGESDPNGSWRRSAHRKRL